VTVRANGNEVHAAMGSNSQEFCRRIAMQDDRRQRTGKTTAESIDPMLQRQISIAAKTGRATPPHHLTATRRHVHQESRGAGRGQAQCQPRRGEARRAEIDRDDDIVRRKRSPRRDCQNGSPRYAHEPECRFVA
jgi:hypothetical protein